MSMVQYTKIIGLYSQKSHCPIRRYEYLTEVTCSCVESSWDIKDFILNFHLLKRRILKSYILQFYNN
jgi:hypothetical protein